MRRLLALLASVIAIGFGLITLLGLLVGDDLGFLSAFVRLFYFRELAAAFLQLVVVTVAVTIVIGIFNLLSVHLTRVAVGERGWPYSFILLLAAILVIVLTIVERAGIVQPTPGQPSPSAVLLETVQLSIETALAALVLFALVYGAYRMMRRRVTWSAILFTVVLLVALLGALPLPGAGISLLAQARDWLLAVPVSAGARGILMGIAMATVVAGLRLLTGQDRSYRE